MLVGRDESKVSALIGCKELVAYRVDGLPKSWESETRAPASDDIRPKSPVFTTNEAGELVVLVVIRLKRLLLDILCSTDPNFFLQFLFEILNPISELLICYTNNNIIKYAFFFGLLWFEVFRIRVIPSRPIRPSHSSSFLPEGGNG